MANPVGTAYLLAGWGRPWKGLKKVRAEALAH